MEGALDWALSQQGLPGGPQVSSVTWRKAAFHHAPSIHTYALLGCVCECVCVCLGSLPAPEGGISWGWQILCRGQTEELQLGEAASDSRRANRHLEWRMFASECSFPCSPKCP